MPQLRNYQIQGINQIRHHWHQGKRAIVLREPTGAGKTEMFSAIAKDFSGRILALSHRRELVHQAANHLSNVLGERVSIFEGGHHDLSCRAVSASIQSFASLPPSSVPPGIELIVFDECHHAPADHWHHCLNQSPSAKALGCTATPLHPSGKPLAHLFDVMVDGPQVRSLIESGYLCDYHLYSLPKPPTIAALLNKWRQLAVPANGCSLPTLIFANSIDHSIDIVNQFNAASIPSGHMDAHTDNHQRDRLLNALKDGSLKILSNYKILTEGIDIPVANVLILLRKMSLTEYLQACGRVLRIHPDKPKAQILDFANNWFRHGLPDDVREWTLDGHNIFDRRRRLECTKCHQIRVFPPLTKGIFTCPTCGNNNLLR